VTRRAAALALAVAAVTTLAGYGARAGGAEAEALGPGLLTVDVGIEHSRFSIDRLVVRQGTVVRFVVRNGDPIAHELVVGDADVHARHAEGTEAVHPPVPGEVSVGPNEDGLTFYEFDEPGTFTFACHLPRHVDHGMVGEVVVRP
jgi:uncharacterized cupredoxin-like copper-binding protein